MSKELKEGFIFGEKNKEPLIGMSTTKLTSKDSTEIQDVEDADTLIVRAAMEKATQFLKVVIVGEDTDFLILLISLAPTYTKYHFSHETWKGQHS